MRISIRELKRSSSSRSSPDPSVSAADFHLPRSTHYMQARQNAKITMQTNNASQRESRTEKKCKAQSVTGTLAKSSRESSKQLSRGGCWLFAFASQIVHFLILYFMHTFSPVSTPRRVRPGRENFRSEAAIEEAGPSAQRCPVRL